MENFSISHLPLDSLSTYQLHQQMSETFSHHMPVTLTMLAYPIFFIHSQVVNTFSYWAMSIISMEKQTSYIPLLFVFYSSALVLVLISSLILMTLWSIPTAINVWLIWRTGQSPVMFHKELAMISCFAEKTKSSLQSLLMSGKRSTTRAY